MGGKGEREFSSLSWRQQAGTVSIKTHCHPEVTPLKAGLTKRWPCTVPCLRSYSSVVACVFYQPSNVRNIITLISRALNLGMEKKKSLDACHNLRLTLASDGSADWVCKSPFAPPVGGSAPLNYSPSFGSL